MARDVTRFVAARSDRRGALGPAERIGARIAAGVAPRPFTRMKPAPRADRVRLGNAAVVLALVAAAVAWSIVEDAWRRPDVASTRWIAAALGVAIEGALCTYALAAARRARRPQQHDDAILVVFATQTGFAEELATRTVQALVAAGRRAVAIPLSRLDAAALSTTDIALFIVATYGDGDPPDTARRFADAAMKSPLPSGTGLANLRYGMLALGDRSYPRFCGFGRDVERWLDGCGASRLFPAVDVDNGSPAALAVWQQRLRPWTGDAAPDALASPPFSSWRLSQRLQSNPGSVGDPAFRLSFEPSGPCPPWEAGDIAVVRLPDGSQRDYSIASLPSDGRIDLLVRRALRPDGEPGHGAQWLTATLSDGGSTDLRVRANHGFRQQGVDASTPMLLIGNGTGLAGLRAHLKARAAAGARRNWLLYGERNAAFDLHYSDDVDAWRRDGTLERVDHAWSRDGERRVHVQQRLLDQRAEVARWIESGAVVLVCGSASGMAEGVDAALRTIVGDATVDALAVAGRYRRDVY